MLRLGPAARLNAGTRDVVGTVAFKIGTVSFSAMESRSIRSTGTLDQFETSSIAAASLTAGFSTTSEGRE
jgi:hypothetical protein